MSGIDIYLRSRNTAGLPSGAPPQMTPLSRLGMRVDNHHPELLWWRNGMRILFLSQDEVKQLLDLDLLLEALADGFKALSSGQVCAPLRNEVMVPAGFLLGMPAYLSNHQIGVKLVSVFHDNHRRGIPGHQALIC